MTSRSRRTALAGGGLVVAAVLSSCIKVDMDVELDDGMASGEAVLAVSEELLELAGEDPGDPFEDTDLPEGATVEPYEEDGYVGQRYVFEDVEISEFDDPESLVITHDEDAGRYEVRGTRDFGSEGDLGGIPDSIAESFDVSISVTFPGEVIEHNGELDGRTVTWEPAMGDVAELHAVAEEGSSSGLAWLWVALAVLAALIVLALVAILSRRRAESADLAATDDVSPDTVSDEATGYGAATPASTSGTGAMRGVEEAEASAAMGDADGVKPRESPASTAMDEAEDVLHGESPASAAASDVSGERDQGVTSDDTVVDGTDDDRR